MTATELSRNYPSVVGTRLEEIRRVSNYLAAELRVNGQSAFTFSRDPGGMLARTGLGPVDLTPQVADGCYVCNTTSCGGATCFRTC